MIDKQSSGTRWSTYGHIRQGENHDDDDDDDEEEEGEREIHDEWQMTNDALKKWLTISRI